jgi:hypothetical protein
MHEIEIRMEGETGHLSQFAVPSWWILRWFPGVLRPRSGIGSSGRRKLLPVPGTLRSLRSRLIVAPNRTLNDHGIARTQSSCAGRQARPFRDWSKHQTFSVFECEFCVGLIEREGYEDPWD